MDIHKPKPWHGAREFLKEYVIIVVGVATALIGEQVVEALHWRHVAQDARASMAPAETSLVLYAGEREAQSACLAAEFRMLRGVLDEGSATGSIPQVASVRNPTRRSWTFGIYDNVVSSQVLPHLPTSERAVVTGVNAWSGYLQRNRDVEVRDWSILRSLEGPRRRIGEAEIADLRAALSDAIYQAGVVRGGARQLAGRIVDHHLLSNAEIAQAWAKGSQLGREGPNGACPARSVSDTDQLLQQLDIPQIPPPNAERIPPNWPRGAG